jgi:hypothetical protein
MPIPALPVCSQRASTFSFVEITLSMFYSIMNIFFDAEHREAHIFEVSELM